MVKCPFWLHFLLLLLCFAQCLEGQNSNPLNVTSPQGGQVPNNGQANGNGQVTGNGQIMPVLQLKIGLLFSNDSTRKRTLFGFGQSAPAISLAVKKAQQDKLLNSNVNLTFTWYMDNCDQADAIGYSTKMILEERVDAIVGPPCLSSALIAGFVGSFYSIPMFFWGATISPDLANQTTYPTVVNINSDTLSLSQAIVSLLRTFQWKEIALVYTQDMERQMCQNFQSTFESTINDATDVVLIFKRRMEQTEEYMQKTLRQLMNRSRIIVTCFDKEENRRKFLLSIAALGIDKSDEYVFIMPALRSQGMLQQTNSQDGSMVYEPMWVDKDAPKDGLDDKAKSAARLALVVDLENSSTRIDQFNKDMYAEMGKYPFYCDDDCMDEPNTPSQYARYLYDAFYMYCLALNKTLSRYGLSKDAARNATYMLENSVGSFQGQTGKVTIDEDGSRIPFFSVTGLDAANNPTIYISINVSNGTAFIDKKYSDEATSLWASRAGKRPLFKPLCGYTGTECAQSFTVYIVSGGSLIIVLLCGTVLGIALAVREKMREQRRLAQESLIPFQELRNLKDMKDAEKMKSMRSMQSSQSGSTAKLTMDSKQTETEGHAFFLYDKQVVFGKKYIVRVRLDSEDMVLLRKIRQFDNDNLNKLLGVCVDGPILLGIWKHCQRGSLKDVIAKEQYVSDTFVMFALIRDITNGLIALHQSFINVHGHLTSENCLINDRWQVKISDYGLAMIHESQPVLKRKLLWTAPELLRESNRLGTQQGDVYSFAIICCELVNKETVWNGVARDDEVEDVIYRLKRTNTTIPYRPQLNTRDEINPSLYHLVRDCWSENPVNRPKMDLVRTLLRQMINSGQNLMDYVFSMLEQYANSLEQEVEERTKELYEEKRKSDILLYRMLPRQVADKLKLGESVEPESFEQATIFFSDVVSFTTLAGKCSPLQVVNLLNNLYTTFDNIIDSHDAYKVETIGDGYLVCSGIPKRNGSQHAKEIAELSFAFLRSVKTFRIDHLPGEQVNLRIGFHTGPAVAGVVGLTMPRYCLFGDSVNTASRMESSGRPGQIHISSTANHFLTNVIGGYATEPRGETIIKGKGVMETFWLLGHQSEFSSAAGTSNNPNAFAAANSSSNKDVPMYSNYVGTPTSED